MSPRMMARLIVTALFLACVLTSTTFAASIKGTVEAAGSGSITVKDDSESSQKIAVDSGAKITLDGKKCKLDDLQAGTSVEVETEIRGDKTVAVMITARSPE